LVGGGNKPRKEMGPLFPNLRGKVAGRRYGKGKKTQKKNRETRHTVSIPRVRISATNKEEKTTKLK